MIWMDLVKFTSIEISTHQPITPIHDQPFPLHTSWHFSANPSTPSLAPYTWHFHTVPFHTTSTWSPPFPPKYPQPSLDPLFSCFLCLSLFFTCRLMASPRISWCFIIVFSCQVIGQCHVRDLWRPISRSPCRCLSGTDIAWGMVCRSSRMPREML